MLRGIMPAACAALATAALLAACGGDDYEPPPLTREAFVGAADPICARAQQQIVELRREIEGVVPSQFPDEDFAAYLEGAARIGGGALADLRELEPQESDVERIAAMLQPLELEARRMAELAALARGSDAQAYVDLASEPIPPRTDLQAFGFEDCASLRLGPAPAAIPLPTSLTPVPTAG